MSRVIDNIRKKRRELDISQEEVANRLNMDASNYNRIEAGKVGLTVDKLEKLAQILQTTLCALIGCEGEESSTLQLENEYLKKLLKEKDEVIRLLRKE